MGKVIHTRLSPRLEVNEHASSLRRQPEMSPAEELGGINNPAPLAVLTTASRSLIKHSVLLLPPYLYSWSSDRDEWNISLLHVSPLHLKGADE